MNKIFYLAIIFWCLSSHAQVQFEKGFYIDNAGVKHNVLIQNSDPKDNPTSIKFKINPNSEVKTADINQIQEYQVSENYFIRAEVNIDRTKDDIRSLSNNPHPKFTKETIFLKMLLDGKADLFIYSNGALRRFFYRVDDNKIEQLVYLNYLKEPNNIAVNKKYQQQLFNDLNCEGISINKLKVLDYKKNDLLNFFKNYNTCKKEEYATFLGPQLKGGFNFRIKTGAGLSSIDIKKNMAHKNFHFGNAIEPRFGIELEYILPFNKNKWGILAEATYRNSSYKESFQVQYSGQFEFAYNSFELYGGLRHYMFLQEKTKIFINGGLLLDSPLNSQAIILETSRALDPKVQDFDLSFSGAFGVGYELANKFSAEVRYTSREIYGRGFVEGNYDLVIDAKYSSVSFILGYNLF